MESARSRGSVLAHSERIDTESAREDAACSALAQNDQPASAAKHLSDQPIRSRMSGAAAAASASAWVPIV